MVLGTEASDCFPHLEELLDDLTFLNPYSALIRYPEKDTDPDEADEAIAAMERVRAALREALGIEDADAQAEHGAEEPDDEDDDDTGD